MTFSAISVSPWCIALQEAHPQLSAPAPAQAAPLHPDDPARQSLETLLQQDPDLRRTRTERVLRYRPTGREPRWLRRLLDALFGESKPEAKAPRAVRELSWWRPLAWMLKVLMVVALVGLTLYLLIRFHAARLGRTRDAADVEVPEALAGLDVRPESLPPDVPSEALARFRAGDPRGALALLYRGALVALLHAHRLALPASATEGDCLRAARPALEAGPFGTLRDLTAAWVRMAYQGEAPLEAEFAALCGAWREAFGGAR